MSKAEEQLRAAGFFNSHGIATWAGANGLPDVWVQYDPAVDGRMARSAAWRVHRPGHVTDPTAHWMDHGSKTFTVSGIKSRERMKLAALEWASERYGIAEWSPIPGVRWALFPAETAKALRAEMRRRLVG